MSTGIWYSIREGFELVKTCNESYIPDGDPASARGLDHVAVSCDFPIRELSAMAWMFFTRVQPAGHSDRMMINTAQKRLQAHDRSTTEKAYHKSTHQRNRWHTFCGALVRLPFLLQKPKKLQIWRGKMQCK